MTLAKATPATYGNLERYETPAGAVELSIDIVRNFICKEASPEEAYQFIQLCKAHAMNPFNGDCYFIKYSGKAQMIVGKNHFTQRAEQNPEYRGIQAGLLISKGDLLVDPVEEIEGSFLPPGYDLLGGWARVFRSDQEIPVLAKVNLGEYHSGQSIWKDKPATMIRKVALVQALREAFPTSFAGLYDESEMNQAAANAPGLDDPKVVCPWHGNAWKFSEKHTGMRFHVCAMGFCRDGVGVLDTGGELLQYWPVGMPSEALRANGDILEASEVDDLPDAVAEADPGPEPEQEREIIGRQSGPAQDEAAQVEALQSELDGGVTGGAEPSPP